MKHIALAGLCCMLGLLTASPAWAADADKPAAEKKARSEKKNKPAALRLNAPGGSGETTAERSARLQRECRGRPNAGACSGHTD